MLDQGKEQDWFASTEIVVLALVAAVGFVVFLVWELGEPHPVVDIRLFARRNFLVATLALSIAYGLIFGNIVLLPLWLQQYMGYTATWAGLAMAPVGLLAIVLSPWVGHRVGRIDPRKLTTVSFLGFAVILWMRAQFSTQADFATILWPTLLQGIAMAFFFIPLQALAYAGLPPSRMASATGLNNFARITAGAVGTSVFTTLWESRASLHHAQLAERVSETNPVALQAIEQLRSAGYSHEQALAHINRLVDQQAFTLAANDLFWLSALLFVALVGLLWTSGRAPGPAAAADGGAH
jgi:DHA2 family multidrug resistance protein